MKKIKENPRECSSCHKLFEDTQEYLQPDHVPFGRFAAGADKADKKCPECPHMMSRHGGVTGCDECMCMNSKAGPFKKEESLCADCKRLQEMETGDPKGHEEWLKTARVKVQSILGNEPFDVSWISGTGSGEQNFHVETNDDVFALKLKADGTWEHGLHGSVNVPNPRFGVKGRGWAKIEGKQPLISEDAVLPESERHYCKSCHHPMPVHHDDGCHMGGCDCKTVGTGKAEGMTVFTSLGKGKMSMERDPKFKQIPCADCGATGKPGQAQPAQIGTKRGYVCGPCFRKNDKKEALMRELNQMGEAPADDAAPCEECKHSFKDHMSASGNGPCQASYCDCRSYKGKWPKKESSMREDAWGKTGPDCANCNHAKGWHTDKAYTLKGYGPFRDFNYQPGNCTWTNGREDPDAREFCNCKKFVSGNKKESKERSMKSKKPVGEQAYHALANAAIKMMVRIQESPRAGRVTPLLARLDKVANKAADAVAAKMMGEDDPGYIFPELFKELKEVHTTLKMVMGEGWIMFPALGVGNDFNMGSDGGPHAPMIDTSDGPGVVNLPDIPGASAGLSVEPAYTNSNDYRDMVYPAPTGRAESKMVRKYVDGLLHEADQDMADGDGGKTLEAAGSSSSDSCDCGKPGCKCVEGKCECK